MQIDINKLARQKWVKKTLTASHLVGGAHARTHARSAPLFQPSGCQWGVSGAIPECAARANFLPYTTNISKRVQARENYRQSF